MDALSRGEAFRRLHATPGIFVLPNPWDIGSARIFEKLGFAGLATTSAGLAFSLGLRDGDASVDLDTTLAHCRSLVEATTVPITADLENGFGASPEAVATTIRRAGEIGLSGGSIEDATLGDNPEPLFSLAHAVERIHAAVEAARALPYPFTLTARAENFVRGRPDVDDALKRLEAYGRAGADVLCAPFLPDVNSAVALGKPYHYIAGRAKLTLAELRELGVRRVTVGASFARLALHTTMRAAKDILERGAFDCFDGLPSIAEMGDLVSRR